MESDDANCDDNDAFLFLVVLLLLVSTLAMVDSSAHFRCDLGVMECCNRIVYPPPRDASDDVVMGDDNAEDASCGDRARVADARRASQGLRLDFNDADAGFAILVMFWIVCRWSNSASL